MSDSGVPQGQPDEEMRAHAELWADCLSEALMVRREQEFQYRLKSAPEIREIAMELGPVAAGEFGEDSPVTYRAIAALITMSHPAVLACLLAGVRPTDDPQARRRWKGIR